MALTVSTVIQATGAHVFLLGADGFLAQDSLHVADLERELGDVSIDSRTVRPHGLFVALPGEHVDGHQFVPDAFRYGARACLISASTPPEEMERYLRGGDASAPSGRVIFAVPDPLSALQALAHDWRRQSTAEVIGITGSIGKTTTKEILAGLLGTGWNVYKNPGNLNTEIGLPLVLLGLKPQHQIAILEMGMYMPGDIAVLARIAAPRIGAVTGVHPIHLERAGTIERIARGKSELVQHLPPDGLAVLDGDNQWTRAMAVSSGVARSLLTGLTADCDVRAEAIESHGLDGISFDVVAEGQRRRIRTRVPGTHVVSAFLISFAIARELGMSWNDIAEAAYNVRLDARQRILALRDDLLLIDDAYNASPLSMNAALDLLCSAPGQKVAVLADMLELGSTEEEDHRKVGRKAAEVVDWLIVRGRRAEWIAEAAQQSGLQTDRIIRVASNREAIEAVLSLVSSPAVVLTSASVPRMQGSAAGETSGPWNVLVKGSRGMRLEDVVQGLRGER